MEAASLRALSIREKEEEKAKAVATSDPGLEVCPVCFLQFPTKRILEAHMGDHNAKKKKKKKKRNKKKKAKAFCTQENPKVDGRSFPTEKPVNVAESMTGHQISAIEAKKRTDDNTREENSENQESEDKDMYAAVKLSSDDNSREERSDQESEENDFLTTKNNGDDELLAEICRVPMNDAGETYLRMGDYVHVLNKTKKDREDGDSEEDRDGCPICYQDHFNFDCPWLLSDSIPAGKTVGRWYDIQCKGCNELRFPCCPEGGRPVMRRCGYCYCFGHWGKDCREYKYMPASEFPQYP